MPPNQRFVTLLGYVVEPLRREHGRGRPAFRLACRVRRDEQTDVFVSVCPSMNVYSQGETEDEAIAAIKSAVGLYIKAAFRHICALPPIEIARAL